MNRNLEGVLSRLSKVRGRNGHWIACCPAHDDRTPSMTIRETEDGTILMHCFSGCSIGQIADALGVDLSDLFPPSQTEHHAAPSRRKFIASDLLRAVSFEAMVVAAAAIEMAEGKPLSAADKDRVLLSAQRINDALELNQ